MHRLELGPVGLDDVDGEAVRARFLDRSVDDVLGAGAPRDHLHAVLLLEGGAELADVGRLERRVDADRAFLLRAGDQLLACGRRRCRAPRRRPSRRASPVREMTMRRRRPIASDEGAHHGDGVFSSSMTVCGSRAGSVGELRGVRVVHARCQAARGERFGEPLADARRFVRIVDLIAADAPRDPRLRHPLRVADGDTLRL